MKPVVQLEPTGCGIASVAALAGVSYHAVQRSARRLGIVAADRRLWSDSTYVRCLLDEYRLKGAPGHQRFSSWSALPARALLAIKWHRQQGRPYWHWVVFVRERGRVYVLDSAAALKRHVRTDFGRMKPKWFLAVTEASRRPDAGLSTARRHGWRGR